MSKNENIQNANSAPIKIVENLGYTNKVVKEPLAFFSRKLKDPQTKYSITELELLSIVECLKEFKSMLWGQSIKLYTDHKKI